MVRETRHLWVGNLPENIREDRIREHFKRYGRVQSVRLLPRTPEEKTGEVQMACTVAFMDIKSAAKAHNAEPKIDDRTLSTKYYEPAAIPSAAAPHSGTPPPYSTSTSPGATRFPNGHGSSDEHGFPEAAGDTNSRFYDRQTGGVGAAPTAAPEGGSGTCRGGRNRDRFRGGGGPRGAPSVWGNSVVGYADTSRYNNSNERSQSDTTGYSSAPSSDTNDRRNSDGVRKKAKSRSGSRSPSPNGSTSTRSPSRYQPSANPATSDDLLTGNNCTRSRSRSSSSSSSSSTSRDTSSTSSRRSRRHRRHYKKANAQPNSASSAPSGDRRPLGIRVSNLPIRSSDTSLKDGLFHEYKKHGKVTWVNVVGQNENRHAIVCFKKPEDAEKALEVSYDKLFFGCKIEVEPHAVCEIDEVDCRYESEVDEYNPKATRTLFIGNLEKDVTASDLRKHFDQFGEIIEIDIKKQGAVSSYAFCQYADIVSVVKAIRKMDGEHLGTNRIKLGFGKSMAYNCVWIDGVAETVTEKYLRIQFEQFGTVTKCVIDRDKGQALVFYEHVTQAQMAVSKMRGFLMKNAKLQVDFASRECQECFFERLEKQGATLEPRTAFTEERRDSSSRSFESTAPSRVSRYDTPTRPRTSSYSSRSSAAAVASPGTPGSATPRGCRDRPRYYGYDLEYAVTLEGAGRHAASHRSYDEYSQGSAASHDDPYDPFEHTVAYLHDSPSHAHLDPLEVRMVPSLVDPVAYGPHDIRNLQKERVHLLEQLEECPSSGDELICPKKRLKLDLLDPAVGDVIIETNRDHNRKVKVMEVRRLSETTLRHHSRRPSVDNSKYAHYAPHTVGCKRRRTGGSDGGARGANHTHYGEHSDGSDLAGSRPGTPLCDENPEFPPGEPPKRTTRERGEAPMVLPLPKWAAQVRSTPEFQRGTITVSGIKGQKEPVNNPLASPPPAATASPRVPLPQHAPRPPSPLPHVPPPASPPPRPPSLSSNSSDSDGATGSSPSLEERIKSLDEKYEKWSGSRALSAAGNDALAVLDANREKFRLRHKLLEIQDLKEVQPSEIVKSMMAKRSVFDEDLKRLESVGEKYEPKDFGAFCNRLSTSVSGQSSGSTTSVSSVGSSISSLSVMAPAIKLTTSVSTPQTTFSCPRPTGTTIPIPVSRGLQYPFPSHPPMQMAAAQPTATSTVPSTPPTPPITSSSTTTVTARNPNLGENRLKSTANVPGDSRTSSVKNRSVAPVVSDVSSAVKSAKPGEKVTLRRNSSSTSPRADVKTRRNSDTSARRIDEKTEEQRLAEKTKEEAERLKREQEELDRLEKERVEKEKQEKERLERERKEKERLERESELEKQRLEKERLEKERQQREKEKERERVRLEKERIAKLEKEKEEREKREREEKERQEREAKEREERELKAKEEQLEKERRRSEDRARNKDSADNHHERSKHRENHSESTTKHRQNNSEKHQIKEDKPHRDEYSKRDGYRERDLFQETTSNKHENLKNQIEREAERRKESIKENRDNNIHDKTKHLSETKERATVETRHMSLDLDGKNADATRRKERNNSLPANAGLKRRMSSHESMDPVDESKKIKLHDHKKMSERRDSKDSTKTDKKNSKHKNNSLSNSHSDDRRKEKEREERHKYKHKLEKQKSKSKSQEKEDKEAQVEVQTPPDPSMNDKDFLAKLNLRSNEDIEKEKLERQKKESSKERRHKDSSDPEKRQEKSHNEKTSESTSKKDQGMKSPQEDKHKSNHKKENRIRKVTTSDSESGDEPKKQHSIFDIVDDGPPYISMYDKVKARSCKNMQKQEEEKRQEKIKAKFSQLKLSRARREEKKRSTSWDEDSDSDKDTEIKSRRSRKLLDSSDESQDRKSSHKKKDSHYSDSDNSFVMRGSKTEPLESTDEDVKVKHLSFKGSKSKIASDSSDDDYQKTVDSSSDYRHEKKFFENDTEVDQLEVKPEKLTTVKNELERLAKKERRNSKLQEMTSSVEHQSFDSIHSDTQVKTEKFNNRSVFDNTTDEEPMEFKKEKSEKREKKHKKKQKKQKHSASSEESCKQETDLSLSDMQEKKHHEKRKEHSKKDKKRDKTKEGRDKSKKVKKSKSESKREGKLENIFGSLSEDSEAGTRDEKPEFLVDENAQAPPTYNTDSEKEFEKQQQEERDREAEHKRKKERKRREKERRMQEAAAEEPSNPTNESSMDFADMCKQLEANIKDDTSEMEFKPEIAESSNVENDNVIAEVQEVKKESKEKKKKRKKSKDEKKHHHHHHHHDKSKAKTPEVKLDEKEPLSISIPDIKVEELKEESSTPNPHHQSLPSLDDIVTEKSPDFMVSPGTRDMVPLISPIPKTPTTSKTKRDKLIPGFDTAEVNENAIKSISVEAEPTIPVPEVKQEVKEEPKEETGTESGDKPRVVISQEETEDAVAALLGESFGSSQFEERYTEEITTTIEEPPAELVDEPNVQDDEEMRKAVQSLEVEGEISKPDTPPSEHELQIDTDTEEQDETEQVKPVVVTPVVYKPPTSPPSLTPIKPSTDIKKVQDEVKIIPEKRTVIAQVWPTERKPDMTVVVPPVEVKQIPTIKVTESNFPPLAKLSPIPETKPATIIHPTPVVIQPQQHQSRHNLPARLPPVATKTSEAPKSPSGGVILNRLPITPVPGPKPLQATTVLLPQPKVAHSSEPPKLTEIKSEPRPRMVFHQPPFIPFSAPGQPPRMVLQPNPILRPINATNYNMYMARPAKLVPLEMKESPVRPEVVKEALVESRPANNILLVPVVPQVVANTHKSPNYILAESSKPVSVITSESSMKPEDVRSKVPVPEAEPSKTVTPPVEIKQPLPNVTDPLHLSLPSMETRTSTPSPVIVANPDVKCDPPHTSPVISTAEKPVEPDSSLPKKEEESSKAEPIKIEPVVAAITLPDPPKEENMKEEPAPEALPEEVEKPQCDAPCKEEPKLKVDLETPTGEPKEDEFWSAKDSVNIESVIKTLGSADELSDTENNKLSVPASLADSTIKVVQSPEKNPPEPKLEDEEGNEEGVATEPEDDHKQEVSVTRSSTRRGRGGRTRGSKVTKVAERGGIQTRRGKLKETQAQTPAQSKRGRGGKVRSERKSSKSESESISTNDVYEFRDDSDDSNKEQRPRLVLTIKSTTSSTSNAQTTTIVKEITKDGAKEIGKEVKATLTPKELIVAQEPIPAPLDESKDEFTTPQAGNTRKSRRLAEKDISRNTVDDTIEDVIKNTPLTRSAANQRRSGRQMKKPPAVGIVESETPRKSPRGRKPNRRPSEAADNSSSEEVKEENNVPAVPPPTPNSTTVVQQPPPPVLPQVEALKEKKTDHCSPKTTMLKRFKGEMTNSKPEPTNLIDPVTGMLIPMRESEEGKYIPLPGTLVVEKKLPNAVESVSRPELVKTQPTVITQPHQVTVVQQTTPKVHSLKAHVLSSQAAKAITSELSSAVQSKPLHSIASPVKEMVPQVVASSSAALLSKPNNPVLMSRSGTPVTSVGPLSPRPGAPVGEVKSQVKPPTLSPSQQLLLTNHKHMMQAREQLQHLGTPMAPKQSAQIVNTQLAHLKHHQVIMGGKPGGMTKPHVMVHQPHLPGQLATPPVSKALQGRVLAQSTAKGVIEPPKVDVSLPSLMLGRPTLSPSAPQTRLAGLPVPGYEASLGEPIHHPLGALRPDLNYMQSHMMYQHYLRQQQHFQRAASMEKSGEEGEEAPVGLTVAGRGATVPHHSPHDRATESPAIGQVYSTPSARLPYHPASRYFDQQPAEPPPAHRPLTSHERAGLPHIPPLGAAERPLGAHNAHLVPDRPTGVIPERPLSAHLAHERPSLSSERTTSTYAPVVGAGLGAAGNLMGAVAKHIGADAPATQRGIQAATPPLASQVPPQAESLCILLKQYPLMWQGLLALKNDQAAVQMYFVSGNDDVAKCSLPKNNDGSTPPLRIFQRMRLEPMQVEGVARKMQMEKEHCMLLALPCGHDHMDVLKQSTNLTWGFITYLQQKQAAGIVNVAAPGTTHPPAYVVHIFPSCDFVNENLRRIAPSLLERVADIAHLLIVITTV